MDNRIPNIIKDFSSKYGENTQVEFLSFNSWLELKANLAKDWTVVAQRGQITEYSNLYTTSCLIQADEKGIKSFLSNSNWYISSEFGIPNKYQIPHEGEEYDDGLEGNLDGVKYLPFTFLRNFNKIIPSKFEIIQHFLLYFNAYWVEEKSEYHSINKEGNIITLIKHEIEIPNEKEKIKIDTHSLRDYLAVRKCYLARFHDHRRKSEKDISNFIEGKFKTFNLINKDSYFQLDLRTDIQDKKVKSRSRLLGKDLVKPYSKPLSHKFSAYKDDTEYLDFIISRDNDGKKVTSTCTPVKLSNYFEDKGTPHFLTPVYFRRELLQKYYAEPSKYTISEHHINYLNIWEIEYDITDEKLIQVYLGDIGVRLPYSEQLHWKQYNVVPKGKISKHRFERDFFVKSSSPEVEEAPITYFKEEFNKIQSNFANKYGETLFKELNINDKHFFDTLHIPLTDEWKELDTQILGISKVVTESFNGKILSKITDKKIGDINSEGSKIKGPLGLLYEYLFVEFNGTKEVIEVIITPFNIIQSMRSSSVAHRKSKDFTKTLTKYKLDKLSNEDKMRKIVIGLISSLRTLNERYTNNKW